eukprot:CAMPEP_0174965280 /NCGR_PEP_ID=MMETSP0004_2-20121128/6349_1 /TAXON_ID=420556 /ORGANISM="Ochromonas sp., Strain CCMP1393" /LENGTH=68 /DNA_ID=CAMNT_0016214101 /DNA_START=798 /DNA_END=1000 /DNA_ORIENTATION=+
MMEYMYTLRQAKHTRCLLTYERNDVEACIISKGTIANLEQQSSWVTKLLNSDSRRSATTVGGGLCEGR